MWLRKRESKGEVLLREGIWNGDWKERKIKIWKWHCQELTYCNKLWINLAIRKELILVVRRLTDK